MKDYEKAVDEMYPGVDLDNKTRQDIIAALKDADADAAAADEKKADEPEKEEINKEDLVSDFDSMMNKLNKGRCNTCTPDQAAKLLDGQMRRVFKG